MKAFAPYLDYLDNTISMIMKQNQEIAPKVLDEILDGQPSKYLRQHVAIQDLRNAGAFFTGSKLSRFALKSFLNTIDTHSTILDPACGAGDLLIACVSKLSKGENLLETLQAWGNQISGRDVFDEFIYATKARLLLAAVQQIEPLRKKEDKISLVENLFPNIFNQSGLTDFDAIRSASHIVINPPFSMVKAPDNCEWASGKVNSAALFLESCVLQAKSGTQILAILPDVLRSGSRYNRWRKLIESHAMIQQTRLYGQFDLRTDIDVFVLNMEILKNSVGNKHHWNLPKKNTSKCVGDKFDICVGPVVHYRDPKQGKSSPFVCAHELPAWKIIKNINNKRKFLGRTLKPPFVVVRRTSRKGDKHRAIGTIIHHKNNIAVENHLIVLAPKSSTLKDCKNLLEILKNMKTTQWLDQRIRCRHLTVSSLKDLPWWSNES